MIGKMVAQYRIIEALGKGGMGKVCKAVDTKLDRTVVLKLLARDLLTNENARRRFMREARLASVLDHPNICTIYEIEEVDGFYYIAMQYVEGQTLKKAINNKPLPSKALLSIALQIADAIAAAHDKGVIHRDIKPQNIMLTPRGQVKVLDFGLAKSLNETSQQSRELTEQGQSLGTPAYMSPEQAHGQRVDRRTDIFSFGVVLYEMATGGKPFSAQNNVELLYAICNERPTPIIDLNPRAPLGLQEIIDKATAKTPADRYQSMHAMLADLKNIASTLMPGQSVVPDGITNPYTPVSRSKWQSLLGFLFKSNKSEVLHSTAAVESKAHEVSTSNRMAIFMGKAEIDDFPIIAGQHKTLAIIPFRSLGGSRDEAWRMALLESLITEFACFKSVTIRPSSYVTRYFNQEVNPGEAGRELGVDAVLIGSILGSQSKLRLTAQLVDISSGGILWAGKLDLTEPDSMKLQDKICQWLLTQLSNQHKSQDPFELLKDENEEIRIDAVSTLKFSADPKAVGALVFALSDVSQRVKAAAAEALPRFGREATPLVMSCLEEALRKSDHATARYAVQVAGKMASAEFVPILLDALTMENSFLASESALALGKVCDLRALPELIESLSSSDANVRFTSAQALGELGDPQALNHLEVCLREDEDDGVRAKALWAISRIRKNSSKLFAGEDVKYKIQPSN